MLALTAFIVMCGGLALVERLLRSQPNGDAVDAGVKGIEAHLHQQLVRAAETSGSLLKPRS